MYYVIRENFGRSGWESKFWIYRGDDLGFYGVVDVLHRNGEFKSMLERPWTYYKTAREANAILLKYVKNLVRVPSAVENEPFSYKQCITQ